MPFKFAHANNLNLKSIIKRLNCILKNYCRSYFLGNTLLPKIKKQKHNHVESHFKSYYKLSINIPFTVMLFNWHCPKKAVIVPYSRTSHDQCHGSVS